MRVIISQTFECKTKIRLLTEFRGLEQGCLMRWLKQNNYGHDRGKWDFQKSVSKSSEILRM